jgi:hypothetical protein
MSLRAVFNWISTAHRLVEWCQAFPRPLAASGQGRDTSHSAPPRHVRCYSRERDGCYVSKPFQQRVPCALHAPITAGTSGSSGDSGGNGGGSCQAVLGFAGGDGSFERLHGPLADGPPL